MLSLTDLQTENRTNLAAQASTEKGIKYLNCIVNIITNEVTYEVIVITPTNKESQKGNLDKMLMYYNKFNLD